MGAGKREPVVIQISDEASTGLDIPVKLNAEVVLALEPRSSTHLVQCLGRSMRNTRSRTVGHLIIKKGSKVESL